MKFWRKNIKSNWIMFSIKIQIEKIFKMRILLNHKFHHQIHFCLIVHHWVCITIYRGCDIWLGRFSLEFEHYFSDIWWQNSDTYKFNPKFWYESSCFWDSTRFWFRSSTGWSTSIWSWIVSCHPIIFPSGNHFDHFRESSGNSFPKKIWNIVERRSCKSVWWFVDGRSFVINKRWIKENGEILDGNNKWMNIRKVFN